MQDDSRKTKGQLIQELNLLRGRVGKGAVDTVTEKARDAERTRVVGAVEHIGGVEDAVQGFIETNLEVSNALTAAQRQVIDKIKELDDLDAAIALKKAELRDLHDKDTILSSTAILLAEHDSKKAELSAELEAFTTDIQSKDLALGRELEAKRQEAVFHLKQEVSAATQQQVEEHRRAEEQWNEEMRVKKARARDEEDARSRNWQLREENLQRAEAEAVDTAAKLVTQLEEQKKQHDVEKHTALSSITREHKYELDMMKKEAEGKFALANQTISAQNGQLTELRGTIVKLQDQLATAQDHITAVAKSALEASSGALATQTLINDRQAGRDGSGARAKS